ncbi:MAG: hypothetical protein AAGF12_12870 [Myxococcota bacterium]
MAARPIAISRSLHPAAFICRGWVVAGLVIGPWGCGGTAANEAQPSAPVTDEDPPAFAPAPSSAPHTGDVVGLATSGGHDQAKGVALRFVLAVRDADEAELDQLLGAQVGRLFPRLSPGSRDRAQLLQQIVQHPRRSGLTSDMPLTELVNTSEINVQALSARTGTIPPGLLESDLVVTFPLGQQGRQYFQILLGWRSSHGGVVVRPGVEPHIVAL